MPTWSCSDPDGPQDIDIKVYENGVLAGTESGQPIDTTGVVGQTIAKTFKVTCTDMAGNPTSLTAHVLHRRQPADRHDQRPGRWRDLPARFQPACQLGMHRSRRGFGHQDEGRDAAGRDPDQHRNAGSQDVLRHVHRPGRELIDEGRHLHRDRRAAGHHDRDPRGQRVLYAGPGRVGELFLRRQGRRPEVVRPRGRGDGSARHVQAGDVQVHRQCRGRRRQHRHEDRHVHGEGKGRRHCRRRHRPPRRARQRRSAPAVANSGSGSRS